MEFLLVFALAASFSGCMGRTTLPQDQRAGNGTTGSQISASYGMADLYNVTLKNTSVVKSGTDGSSSNIYTLPGGTTVRVLGKVDNKWYVVLPSNNRVGVIPINNATPTPTAPAEPIPDTAKTPASGGTAGGTAAGNVSGEEGTMINLVNAARTAQGLKPLTKDDQLVQVARLKSQDLVKNNYFAHVSPTYGSPFDMLKKYGISYLYAGENLAKNTNASAAHTALMNSPGHKANILNANFTHIGIGIAAAKDGSKIYTQMFIGR